MKKIQFNKSSNDPISVEITVETALPWKTQYVEQNGPYTYTAKSSDNNAMPMKYPLGYAADMGLDVNTWTIYFFDVQNNISYRAEIVWKQGTQELHREIYGGNSTNTGTAISFGDSAFFMGV